MPDDRIEDIDERMLVLRDKAAREGFAVPPDVLEYIAQKYALPQTLKGALINVQAYASRRNIAVDMDVARLVLDGIRASQTAGEAVEATTAEEAQAEESTTGGFEPLGAPFQPAEQAELAPEAAPEPAAAPVVVETEPAPHDEWPPAEPDWPPAEPEVIAPPETSFEESLVSVLGADVDEDPSLFVVEAPQPVAVEPHAEALFPADDQPPAESAYPPASGPSYPPAPEPVEVSTTPSAEPAVVWFAPMRTSKKESLVTRAGRVLQRAGLAPAIDEGDLVAVKLHFGEEGNTGFVSPVFVREIVRLIREAGGKPFLTDSNTLYRGKRANAVDHLECAIHNGFSFATVEAPLIIADGIDGRDAVEVPISGFDHFDSVKIGAAAAHADAMVVVTHVKGHEATGMGGAIKNVGMGLGNRSAKQRMHSDLKPEVAGEKCTACGRCVKWCPIEAIAIAPDRVARIDYELCYGCGECVASCPYGAIGIQWKTEPAALQQKIVEHVAGAVAGKEEKVVYISFVMNVSPDCDCWHFSDASVVPDIGVLASTDIVAIDQAAYDLINKATGLPGTRGEGMGSGTDKLHEITGVDPTLELDYAERHGLGTRSYELRTLD